MARLLAPSVVTKIKAFPPHVSLRTIAKQLGIHKDTVAHYRNGEQYACHISERAGVAFTPLSYSDAPCGLHWDAFSGERSKFLNLWYPQGVPFEIIDQLLCEENGPPFTPDDLAAEIKRRDLQRPEHWDEHAAWDDWHSGMNDPASFNGGEGPFGVRHLDRHSNVEVDSQKSPRELVRAISGG